MIFNYNVAYDIRATSYTAAVTLQNYVYTKNQKNENKNKNKIKKAKY